MSSFKKSPCKDCPERFTACSDKCPKDARGEYGYKTWKAELQKEKAAEIEYKRRRREDYAHSEERQYNNREFVRYKTRLTRGDINYGRK